MSKVDGKNHSAILTTVLPETIERRGRVGRDDIYVGKTSTGEAVMVIMPGLHMAAPRKVRQWMLDRATANLTGRCPRCEACIDVTTNHESQIRHEAHCEIDGRPAWVGKWLAW